MAKLTGVFSIHPEAEATITRVASDFEIPTG